MDSFQPRHGDGPHNQVVVEILALPYILGNLTDTYIFGIKYPRI